MGARPERQLALNFLTAIHDLWVKFPGEYLVHESVDDLVPALAQMCIKALAADVRDGVEPSRRRQVRIPIEGCIVNADGSEDSPSLRDVVNKVIHGTPTLVMVKGETVQLHFHSNDRRENWVRAWFSATRLIQVLNRELFKHPAGTREDEIGHLLQELGEERFLPTRVVGDSAVM